MMQDEMAFFVRPDDVVHDTIDGETVVIDLQRGVYFRFDGAATHTWALLQDRATEAELVDRLAAAYAAPREAIAAQVHDFLITLYRDGIIRREARSATAPARAEAQPEPDAPAVSGEAPGQPFVGLAVERFDQLQPLVGISAEARLPFDGMTVSRFEDLDELLVIDPVHEVRDEGWPHRQAAD
jgi:hypothetical protein